MMRWSEVRSLYPNQFVYVEDVNSRMEDGKLVVEEVAVIRALADSHEALDAMKTAKNRRFIYHTAHARVVMDVIAKPLVRGMPP